MSNNNSDKTEMREMTDKTAEVSTSDSSSKVSPLSSEELRKLATLVREEGKRRETDKVIKCAKYVMGITALTQLRDKIRSL